MSYTPTVLGASFLLTLGLGGSSRALAQTEPSPAVTPPPPAAELPLVAPTDAPVPATEPSPAVPLDAPGTSTEAPAATSAPTTEAPAATSIPPAEPTPATPEPPVVETAAATPPGSTPIFPVTGGAALGTLFPQVFSDLGTSVALSLEAGYLVPFWEQRVTAWASVSYSRPTHTGSGSDPRLGGGSYEFKIKEQQLAFAVGGLVRFFPPKTQLNFFGRAGLRLELQRTDERASADAGFGVNRETATEVGGVLGGGAEWTLGPGAVAAELAFTLADLDHRLTGETTAGGLMLFVGYHVLY